MGYTIDLQKIADALDFDLEDVEMLTEGFLESSQESLSALKSAIEANDLEFIFRYAHAIKGSASNLTLDGISSLAKEMERCSRENKEINYQDSYERLASLINAIKA